MKVKTLIAISTLVLLALILISCAHEEGYTHTEATTPVSEPENIDDCELEEIEMENTEYLESEESKTEDGDCFESDEAEIENSEHSESDASNQEAEDEDEDEDENDNDVEQEQTLITKSECIVLLENPIDLRLILWQDFDEVKHLFGNEISRGSAHIFDYVYSYEVGLRLGVISDNDNIKRIHSTIMDFSQTYNCTCVHLSGINGTSTRDEVVALFGDCPYNTRSSTDEERVGAVISYGYWIEEHRFARFFFDDDDRVVSINYFMAES